MFSIHKSKKKKFVKTKNIIETIRNGWTLNINDNFFLMIFD